MITFDEQVPVTVVVTRRVKQGVAEEFEKWLHVIAADAMKFEGHLGVNVIRPPAGSQDYTIVFRFQTPAQLKAWFDSDVRARRLEEAAALFEGEASIRQVSGIEAWFTLPDKPTRSPPPRYKMAILTFAAVLSLLMVIPRAAAPILEPLPALARTVAVSATMIALMTYVVMPYLTRLFYGWLYPQSIITPGPAR